MHWNYRLVDMTNDSGPCFQVMEVYYDDNDKPIGYAEMSLLGETPEEAKHDYELIGGAFKRPVIKLSELEGCET